MKNVDFLSIDFTLNFKKIIVLDNSVLIIRIGLKTKIIIIKFASACTNLKK